LRSALQSYKKHRELILTEANEEPDLTGVDWKYEYGLVAQDLEAQGLNHFVHTKTDEPNLKSVSYLEFVPILIQRVKELEADSRHWKVMSRSFCNTPRVAGQILR